MQLEPAAKVIPQVLVAENGAVEVNAETLKAVLPVLLRVTVWAGDVAPTASAAKFKVPADRAAEV